LIDNNPMRFHDIRIWVLPLVIAGWPPTVLAQCEGNVSTPRGAADCAATGTPRSVVADVDPGHAYTLAELIDLAERNNPRTRVAWERAKQKADQLGIERSAYYPILAADAVFANERIIQPFPKPLAPQGYTVNDISLVQPEITLRYLLFDSGKRKASVDIATAETLLAGANFIQTNQEVAFRVATAYYTLLTAQERLQATKDTLKTAQTTQDAAEAQLRNGRATLPDVLNAKAEASQAVFDEESADGDETISRVGLRNAIGAEPSPDITIDAQQSDPLPQLLTLSIDELVDRALTDRPDLLAQAAEIRASASSIKAAKAEFGPRASVAGLAAQTSLWPSTNYGQLGSASKPTWSAALEIEWRIFDGSERKRRLAAAESKHREAQDEMTDKRDRATREVWSAYIAFRTAIRKEEAAVALLASANASYSASLEAYGYGVRNLIDVVTAEKQLALARLSGVAARSDLFLQAVNVEYVTGNLLRTRPPAVSPQVPSRGKP
jgi:outer membrane protein